MANEVIAREENSTCVVNKVLGRLNGLRTPHLSLHQRVIVVNALLYSKIWHIAAVYPLVSGDVRRLLGRVFKYIWGSGCDWLRREVVTLPVAKGRLRLISLGNRLKGVYVRHEYGEGGGGCVERKYSEVYRYTEVGGSEIFRKVRVFTFGDLWRL